MRRLVKTGLRAALIGLILSLCIWIITAGHGIITFGIIKGYLHNPAPLYPSLTIGYADFFFQSIIIFMLAVPVLTALLWLVPKRWAFWPVSLAALVLADTGAGTIAFNFQIDFGSTWAPGEAFWELFFDPILTPVSIALILISTAIATRANQS